MPRNTPAPATEPLLTCPYTGETFTLVSVGTNTLGSIGWTTTGGLDPAAWHADRAQLEAKLRLRNGRPANVVNLVCVYTGRPLVIMTKKLSNGETRYRASGAWSPRGVYTHREELLFDLSTRRGVKPAFERRIVISAGGETRQESDPTEGLKDRNTEYADQLVEHVLEKGE